MLRNTLSRLFATLSLSLLALPFAAFAQTQDTQSQSIADAARRAREKKQNATKPTKVVTDDDIPARPSQAENQQAAGSAVQSGDTSAPAAGAPANASASTDAPATASGSADAAAKPSADPALAKLKDQLAQAQKEVDAAKREQSLAQDTYYANPDYAHDKAGKAKLDDLQQQIADKQQAVDRLKEQLANYKPSAPPKQ